MHVYFLIGTRNRLTVAFAWLWNYLTYQRSARLITGTEAQLAEPEKLGQPAEGRPEPARQL